jgi:hypothetical protein
LLTIDEIEKKIWDKMQKAIAQKDARAVAALNAMAFEVGEIKERVSSLTTKLAGPDLLNGTHIPSSSAPPTVQPQSASTPCALSVVGNYTGRSIHGYRLDGTSVVVRTYKDLLISLSNGLRKKHASRFDQYALQLGGRKRRYFSRNQQDLKYAHEIDGGLFVETNLNANLIVNNICIPLLRQLEPSADFEIH